MAVRRRHRRPLSRTEIRSHFERLRRDNDPAAREALILAHESLAVYLAGKFSDRGEPLEDLVQVAQIGLINAVDRYDPARGIEFATFATPTIVGEIRRHFRDKLSSIRIPRGLREVNQTLMRSVDMLSQRLGRSPTIQELVDETGIPFDAVLEALEAGRAYTPASLDADGAEEDGDRTATLLESLGREDEAFQRLEDRATLAWAIGRLPPREREIVSLRFFERLSQGQIAAILRVSQMHVSRLQRTALERLRAFIATGSGDPSS